MAFDINANNVGHTRYFHQFMKIENSNFKIAVKKTFLDQLIKKRVITLKKLRLNIEMIAQLVVR